MVRFGSKMTLMMALGGAFLLNMPSPAKAVFFVTFKDLTAPTAAVAVFDQGPGDLDLTLGKIATALTSVGDFLVSASAEASNSPGTATSATLTMGVSDVRNLSAGTQVLEVTTTATDYTAPAPPVTIKDSATITVSTQSPDGSAIAMTARSWVSSSNLPGLATVPPFADNPAALQNPTTLLVLGGPKGSSTAAPPGGIPIPQPAPTVTSVPYSITNRGTYTFSGGAIIGGSSVTTEVNPAAVIPGPGGLALALAGLPFLGVSWLRRRGKRA